MKPKQEQPERMLKNQENELAKDWIGSRFGHLTIIDVILKKLGNKSQPSKFKVRCDCGNEKYVWAYKWGAKLKSCGCLRYGITRYSDDEFTTRFFIRQSIRNAKKRGIKFLLTYNEVFDLIFSPCFYCGRARVNKQVRGRHSISYNGIDRVDSKKDYISKNVVPCCFDCNRMKLDSPKNLFLSQIKLIYQNLKMGVDTNRKLR